MKKKFIFVLLLVIVAVMGLSIVSADTGGEQSNNTTFSIKAQQPTAIGDMIDSIKTNPHFKTYDIKTLNWLKDLGSDYVVFSTKDYYILMNSSDASKLSGGSNTGISVNSNVTCNVLENKSLGSGLNNVVHVENVEVVSANLNNFDFGN